MAATVRIEPKVHAKLAALARAKHLPLTEVLARAIDAYDRAERMARFNVAYAKLRKDDPEGWQQEIDERALWDHSNIDGLEDDNRQAQVQVSSKSAGDGKAASRATRRRKRG